MLRMWKTTVSTVGVLSLIFGFPFVMPWLSSYQRSEVLIIEMIVIIECLLFFVQSTYIWNTVSMMCQPHIQAAVTTPKIARHLLKCVMIIVIALSHYAFVAKYFYYGTDHYYINFISFISLGLTVQFFFCHLIISQMVRFYQWMRKARFDYNRAFTKPSVQRIIFTVAALVTIVLSTYGIYHADLPPIIKNVDIPINGLSHSMDQFCIAVISDLHLGPTVGRDQLTRVVNIVNELNPDIIVFVGDLTDGSLEHVGSSAEPLCDMHAKRGKYFVTGNHEYYTGDVEAWFTHLQHELGFTVLHNSNVHITNDNGDYFCLAGTDDLEGRRMNYAGHGMDLEKAVGSCDRQHPIILLAHQPRAAKIALSSDYNIQLVLSGHIHGGQMFPMIVIAYIIEPFFAGLYQYGSGYVYVTQGTIYWGIPMRQFSDAEVTRVYLRSAE